MNRNITQWTAATAICTAILSTHLMAAKQAPEAAKTVVDAAVKVAKAGNKTVLIHFGASW